ncbi:MAG: AAA family ATPase [Chlorobiaceae bacterium]
MIESIRIAGVASYSQTPEFLTGLSKYNFLYGSNGSGKTTISRLIADDGDFPTCSITWTGTKLQTMVYNRDFIKKHFSQSSELKGIFTLGAKNINILKEIASAKMELDAITNKIEHMHFVLHGQDGTGGKMGELATLDEKFRLKCWSSYTRHKAKLGIAFEGFRSSREKFKDKILKERACNSSPIKSLAVLEKIAETLFGPAPTLAPTIPSIDAAKIITHESAAILKKKVIGKEDVDIAAMIKKLGNSDWVREGHAFYDENEMACPFCQQNTTDAFAQSLNQYYDEAFKEDSRSVDDLCINYKDDSARLQREIASVISTPSKFLDVEKLKKEKELLDLRFTMNLQRLTLKKKEPSQVIELQSTSDVLSTIGTLVDDANALNTEHNKMLENLAHERSHLTEQVWKFILEEELKKDLLNYDSLRNGLNKAIADVKVQIQCVLTSQQAKVAEIKALERSTTSIQPTIDAINALLISVGFDSFSLATANNKTGCYKLIRMDGSDAKETLSEGESSFLSLLYFFHLLKGSNTESGMTTDRVAVFDDPVSSLDNDILLIVGALMKELYDEIQTGKGNIKQIFILTHNMSFYKEVTFNPDNLHFKRNESTFWTVKKNGLKSKIQKLSSNHL